MTQTELIKELISYYENTVFLVQEAVFPDWRHTLVERCAQYGACFLSTNVFSHTLGNWKSKYYVRDSAAWGRYPIYAKNEEEAIELLHIRLINLKKELYDTTYISSESV